MKFKIVDELHKYFTDAIFIRWLNGFDFCFIGLWGLGDWFFCWFFMVVIFEKMFKDLIINACNTLYEIFHDYFYLK